ncbi:TetR family transcriptional regulator [Streptomyces hoynatensis]|uniref:TetR family transcriptional regulator n=1 Tax=Streptomyces hoynatensis TaxID=1141874 RepID=A0A3A9YQZ8_9ACTN|nr:TetR family transcriptional regulator [Streptomyces hoynatensis]RKN37904.1 TetR family transcriptional regulator [Streptomyces hoynatensis]
MGRWQPNARGRLQRAALELYGERGFEQTTVAEIAQRAGLTERTFFRHFTDKREVLFANAEEFEGSFVRALVAAPEATPPIEAVAAAAEAGAGAIQSDRAQARRRQAVIAANAELQERELTKLARLTAALAGALRERGVPPATASLAAEAGVAVFKVAFERWIGEEGEEDLPRLVRQSLDELRALAAGAGAASPG